MTLHFQDLARAQQLLAGSGIVQGTPVLTLDGEIPVEFLEVGDRVLTRAGARTLKSITVTTVTNARLVRFGAATFGGDQAQNDVLVPAAARVMVRDWRAKALAGGASQALIAASRLTDGEFICGEVADNARLYRLGFDDAVIVYAGGIELECSTALQTV